jgi:predicted dehydrogenase
MKKIIRWGILGPGRIAHKFAQSVKCIEDAEITAVGSRSIERAAQFATEYSISRAYGSYIDLASDPDVDIIYVAAPHPAHFECALLCLKAGKAVLCEKPFTLNASETKVLIKTAGASKLFLMEAMWMRYLPAIVKVRELLAQGTIGEVRMIKADFGNRIPWEPAGRLLNPELGGGALLDVGIYPISFASMVLGPSPTKITGVAYLGETCDQINFSIAKISQYRPSIQNSFLYTPILLKPHLLQSLTAMFCSGFTANSILRISLFSCIKAIA